jgi:lipoprotein-releasing system permease protein
MDIPFELHVALRYLLARRKQAFISLISLISTVGVAVGVMALVVALALMTGLQQELRDRIVGSTAHIYVWKVGEGGIADYHGEAARLLEVPGVIGAAPVMLEKALIQRGDRQGFIQLKGVDPALERAVTDIAAAVETGSFEALEGRDPEARDAVVIGRELASQLGVFVGDTVTVITPEGALTPWGYMPRPRTLEVAGIFSLGLFEYDAGYGFVSLDVARRLLGKQRVDFIQLRVDDIYAAPRIAAGIPDWLGPQYVTQDWAETNRALFSALWLEKMAISITIGLIVMVAALNIIASLILLVMEKSRDIAILKTMGASAASIMGIFILQGLIIGLAGTGAGATVGYVLADVLDRYRLIRIPMDVYQVAHLPFIVQPFDFVLVVIAAVAICFLATIYPSRQAARLDPAQALRYQ